MSALEVLESALDYEREQLLRARAQQIALTEIRSRNKAELERALRSEVSIRELRVERLQVEVIRRAVAGAEDHREDRSPAISSGTERRF